MKRCNITLKNMKREEMSHMYRPLFPHPTTCIHELDGPFLFKAAKHDSMNAYVFQNQRFRREISHCAIFFFQGSSQG